MKMKYFQLLQEKESQKLSVQGLIEKDQEMRKRLKIHEEHRKKAEKELLEIKEEVRNVVSEESERNGKAISLMQQKVDKY